MQGIHVVLSVGALPLLKQVLDERLRELGSFSHRVSMQISEDDSFTLFRSRKGAQLRIEGVSLLVAWYANMDTNQTSRFKPFESNLTPIDLTNLEKVGRVLAQRPHMGGG